MFMTKALPQGGYRPDVYCVENIIGYTGSIHQNPTVYFLSSTDFGHITQSHPDKWNIGREPVQSRIPESGYHYEIKNVKKNGIEVGGEYCVADDGSLEIRMHKCRSKFISCERAGMNTFALLAQAIWRFPYTKEGELRRNRRA